MKFNALKPVEWSPAPAALDPTAFEAFEKLRLRVESDVAIGTERSRRPTWAPPMILGEELDEACYTLGYLTSNDKGIGRLWAMFATPKHSGRYLREHISTLPLPGIGCRGFQFHAGEARGPTRTILFEAQRTQSGEWQFGPHWYPTQYRSSSPECKYLIRERVRVRRTYNHPSQVQELELLLAGIEAIETEERAEAQAHNERQQLRGRALKLARLRVLDFIGAPDVQMQMAGRLWGHCCICGLPLIDPISLERGIGPDCFQHQVNHIKVLAQRGYSLERITRLTGMPLGFVTELMKEAQHG